MKAEYYCSWSGGKDAALALHRAQALGASVGRLLTMMIEDGSRSRSHGLRREVLEAQARRMRTPITFVPCSWSTYEERFLEAIHGFASDGITSGIFGDIDFPRNRAWVEKISAAAALRAIEPLWRQDRMDLLSQFIDAGFRAKIVAIKEGALPRNLLGEELNWDLLREIEAHGCDPSGERGEYHTVTYDGPLFTHPVLLERGELVHRAGYLFQDFRRVLPLPHVSPNSRRQSEAG